MRNEPGLAMPARRGNVRSAIVQNEPETTLLINISTLVLGLSRAGWFDPKGPNSREIAPVCMIAGAPVTEKSGQSRWIHWRWACPNFLRQTFHEYAEQSIQGCDWARQYYEMVWETCAGMSKLALKKS